MATSRKTESTKPPKHNPSTILHAEDLLVEGNALVDGSLTVGGGLTVRGNGANGGFA